jgi:quercetin dioxygenase-like cupin family protein
MPEHDVGAIICAPGEGVTVQNPVGGPLTFKVRGSQTNGALTVFETTAAPGEGPPLHVHANEDEVLYTLEGTLRFRLGDEVSAAPAGAFAFIPRGVPHTWQNVGEAPARMLVIFTPAGMERFFDRFAELPDDVSAPEAFRTIGSQVGMDVVGPPLAQSESL